MRKGYSNDVDFYALGCVMFFLFTKELLSTRAKSYSPEEAEDLLVSNRLSNEGVELVMFLTNENNRVTDMRGKFL
jgi:hypothetical protein